MTGKAKFHLTSCDQAVISLQREDNVSKSTKTSWKHQPWGTGEIGLLDLASSRLVVTNLEFFNLAAASSAPSLECINSVDGKINLLHLEDFHAAGTTAASSLCGRPTLRPWDPASDLFLEPHGHPTGHFTLSGHVPDFIMPAFACYSHSCMRT